MKDAGIYAMYLIIESQGCLFLALDLLEASNKQLVAMQIKAQWYYVAFRCICHRQRVVRGMPLTC